MEGIGGAVSLEQGCGTADPAPDLGGRGRRCSPGPSDPAAGAGKAEAAVPAPRRRPEAPATRPASHRVWVAGRGPLLAWRRGCGVGLGLRAPSGRGDEAGAEVGALCPRVRPPCRGTAANFQGAAAAAAAKRPLRSAKLGRPDAPYPPPASTAAAPPALEPRARTGTRAPARTPLLPSRPPLLPGTPPLALRPRLLGPRPTTPTPASGPGPLP